jgi:hypothetical protein
VCLVTFKLKVLCRQDEEPVVTFHHKFLTFAEVKFGEHCTHRLQNVYCSYWHVLIRMSDMEEFHFYPNMSQVQF